MPQAIDDLPSGRSIVTAIVAVHYCLVRVISRAAETVHHRIGTLEYSERLDIAVLVAVGSAEQVFPIAVPCGRDFETGISWKLIEQVFVYEYVDIPEEAQAW